MTGKEIDTGPVGFQLIPLVQRAILAKAANFLVEATLQKLKSKNLMSFIVEKAKKGDGRKFLMFSPQFLRRLEKIKRKEVIVNKEGLIDLSESGGRGFGQRKIFTVIAT